MGMELGRPIRRVPRKAAPQSATPRAISRSSLPELEDMKPDDQCYYLHCKGFNLTQISILLGIDRQTVTRRIKKASASVRPNDEDRLNWFHESIDAFQQVKAAAWAKFAESGDPYLLAQITAAQERIAKIYGLIDTQRNTKIEVSGPNGGSIPVEFAARAALAAIASGSTEDR